MYTQRSTQSASNPLQLPAKMLKRSKLKLQQDLHRSLDYSFVWIMVSCFSPFVKSVLNMSKAVK